MSKQSVGCLFLVVMFLCVTSIFLYQLPPINERLAWRVEAFQARIRYAINPPEQVVFQPVGQPLSSLVTASQPDRISEAGQPTPTTGLNGPTPTAVTSLVIDTPAPTATPTPVPTPLPGQVLLTGITHMYQMWNNCGPANLAMALSYWGWQGDQRDTAAYTKPNKRDKNVMPYEMADFVNSQTELRALVRVGGDLETLKALVAAGFPTIVEKGFEGPSFEGWMGHYEVINGYDDQARVFYVQDSYNGPDLKVGYDTLAGQWRAFNYTYMVIFPPERETQALSILGAQADTTINYQTALERTTQETTSLSGRDLYFAWFNRGTNLVYLHDYQNAAVAYDAAFANYSAIPEDARPWRMLWYQTGPYFAYYYTGRYQDVIDLADNILSISNEPVLEESYYWRGMARLALGDQEGAIADFRKSAEVHPDFGPAVEQLIALGVEVK